MQVEVIPKERKQLAIRILFKEKESQVIKRHDIYLLTPGPLLLTWFNFNPSMDK